ncbi:hypothetical protein F5Y01DRAFT_311891 [Xylaria sp. FL0043]|nr:hypothetical protein F5Y01DRAFT_311891 [Xylaria sp. FL0043]
MPKARTKAANHVDGESGGQSVVKPCSKKSRLSRMGEYDEDPGRAGSLKYQRLANILKKVEDKSEVFLDNFRNDVERESVQLKAFRLEKEEAFAKDQEKHRAMMSQLSHQLPNRNHERLGALRKEDHPLFQKAQAQRDDFNSLLKQLEIMEQRLNSDKLQLPLATWKQDKQDMKELLAYGGRYGEILLGGALAPELAASPEIDLPGTSEKDQLVKEFFKEGRKVLDGETWGHVAEDQLKQLSAIARALPLEEEK